MGFKKKNPKQVQVGFGLYQKTRDLAWLKTWHLKLQKYPVYIYIYIYIYSYILTLIPYFFTLQHPTLTLPQSSLLTLVWQSLILA